MKKIKQITFLIVLISSLGLSAQNSVNGSILDENNQPIPGVTIVEKGTSNGVTSDFDGNFTIQVESGSSLVISSIGFVSQEVLIGREQEITMNLVSDIVGLEEVIVTTGYGNQKKSSISGSVVTLSSENLVSRGVQN